MLHLIRKIYSWNGKDLFAWNIFFRTYWISFINPANRNLANSITLNISRAWYSSTKCCVPSCNRELPAELHRIPLKVRYEISLDFSRQIPNRASGFILSWAHQGKWNGICCVCLSKWRMPKKFCRFFFPWKTIKITHGTYEVSIS